MNPKVNTYQYLYNLIYWEKSVGSSLWFVKRKLRNMKAKFNRR